MLGWWVGFVCVMDGWMDGVLGEGDEVGSYT
jgi:hypothetical protein